ncbi:MAG: Trm112 family protein [bacterium]|nr:Trm112 family protein [bacterium]
MALSQKLLEKLVCPQCKGKLEYVESAAKINCGSCKLSFRVVDDIPVLLVDEAEKL